MRMTGYYLFHSFINQIRKLLKTWVLVFFLICGLIGGVIGFTAATLFDDSEESATEEIVEDAGSGEDDAAAGEDPEKDTGFLSGLLTGIEKKDIFELAAGMLILVMFVYCALSADKSGSSIFLPADVTLLFPSPLRPQSVLLFRLICKLGTIFLLSFLLLAETAGIYRDLGLGLPAAIWIVSAWILTLVYGELLQIWLYMTGGTHPELKKRIRTGIYACLLALGGAFLVFWQKTGQQPVTAAVSFFNNPVTRYIPVWGWLKGIALAGVEQNVSGGLICAGLCIGGTGILGNLIWRVRADFYEDAMAKSEETAALLEAVRERGSAFGVRKKDQKDRDDRILRDGLNRGLGAGVFFFKNLYNRYRFAHFHFFTKTSETFLLTGAAAAVLASRMAPETGMAIPAFVLGGMTFFRSLQNPLEDELKSHYFLLVPEPLWKKLLAVELGSAVCILLDLIPGMLAAMLIFRADPLTALGFLLVICTLYFYSLNVGSFISSTTPPGAGVSVKQIVQVMFVYFGLIPDAGLIAAGFSQKVPALTLPVAVAAAAAVNVVIGLIFMVMIPVFLYPAPLSAKEPARELTQEELREAEKTYSRCGMAGFVVAAVATILQLVLFFKLRNYDTGSSILGWIVSFAPIYGAAFPLGFLLLKRTPVKAPAWEDAGTDAASDRARLWNPLKPGAGRFLTWLLIAFFLMYGGNLIGLGVNTLIGLLLGGAPVNPVAGLAMDESLAMKFLVMVVLAPLFEELFFRKALISHMKPYGEKTAVILSALMFGLFHGNFSQLFYAFFLGLLFGYVFVKTEKLRYSLMLHMIINFLGSVLAPGLLAWGEARGNAVPLYLYIGFMAVAALAGLVLLIIRSRSVEFRTAPFELPKSSVEETAYLNWGMILFDVACIGIFTINLMG